MCGIAGIIHRDPNHPVPPERLERMLTAIRHRGPDDQGVHIDGHVALGMRRLSIIDLSGGHQPIYDEAEKRIIVFNGEIYNYKELHDGLTSRGHKFRTSSDTETIVHLHEEKGTACVEDLRGMFGFALWNRDEQELLLARDRFGMKPLYIVTGDWGIAFASELKALHAAGFTGADLDWEALEGLFRVGYIGSPRTPFCGVRKLEAGNVLIWRPGRETVTSAYWDVPNGASKRRSEPEEAVRERLDESVRAHLVADVPVAAFLSGGMDSSGIVSSMAMAGEDVHAYTVRYRGSGAPDADETPLAQALADRYGVRLTVVDVEPKIEELFEPIVTAMDEPHGDESTVPTWLICEAVAKDYKVALVGTGGDELFGGYRRHMALGAAGAWNRLPGFLRNGLSGVANGLPEPKGSGLGVTRLKRFLRSTGDSLPARYLSLQDRLGGAALFTPDVAREVGAGYTARLFERHGANAPTDGLVRPALYLDYKTYLPEDLLHLADRLSMAHSLELRLPFVDHEMVEDLFPVPDATRIGLARPKRLLRRALRPRLPKQHFSAPKRGFVGPTAMWLRNELSEMVGDELAPDRLKRLGFFDVETIDRLRREHMERRHNHEGVLWSLLCFLSWHRTYVETRVASWAG